MLLLELQAGEQPSPASPAAIPASVRTASQPASGASMMLNTSATRLSMTSEAPPLSSGGAAGLADSGTKRIVPAIAITASTTLTAKADRQENASSSAPVHSSPSIALPPATPAHTEPRGCVRRAGMCW